MPADDYDYVIVGAGSAGCVLADRLTVYGRYKVLLIEAGGRDRRFWIKVPLSYAKTFNDRKVNWCYTAEADNGLEGRRAFWPRGRVLGGSSSINAMAYLRGLPHDFDVWERAGATGWNWETVRQTYE
ncbi:MAG: GMC family oxidoreductase N-terminal domain-containing protein, partial [Albidovulum sp.]